LKVLLIVLSVIIIIVLALLTLVFANRGENEYTAQYLADAASPSVSSSVSPSPKPTVTPHVTPSPMETATPYNGPVNPLTGLPVDEKAVRNRPVALMINNLKTAQPQLGVSKADIIYEILVEGGITRMMALFQDISGTGVIGSIRSARPYFIDIANGYEAIYIHAGGSPDAYVKLKNIRISHLDGVNGGKQDIFYRDKARQRKMGYEHSLVTTSDLISEYLPKYNFKLLHSDGFQNAITFADNAAPVGGATASNVTVHFSSSKKTVFDYSEPEGMYYISQYGKPYADGNDDTKISVTNVLVLKTRIRVISGDTEGRIDVDTVGSGSGVFICGGKCTEIQWSRKNNDSQFAFTLTDGTPLTFGRGRTYICVIDKSNTVEIQ